MLDDGIDAVENIFYSLLVAHFTTSHPNAHPIPIPAQKQGELHKNAQILLGNWIGYGIIEHSWQSNSSLISYYFGLEPKEMMNRISFVLSLGLAIAFIGSTGCGSSSEPAANQEDEAKLKVVGILYGKYLQQSRGNASGDQKQLIIFLDSERPNWEKLAENAEQLLTSPRDGKPLVLLSGKELHQQKSAGAYWVAYESDGVNGKRLVVSARGLLEEMDEQKFKQVFP